MVVWPYNGILLDNKKKWSADTCCQGKKFENIMLNWRNQSQRPNCYMIPFTWNVQKRQVYRDIKYISDCLGLEEIQGLDGVTTGMVFFWGWWNVLKLTMVADAQICEYTKNHEIVHFKRWIVWYVYHISIETVLKRSNKITLRAWTTLTLFKKTHLAPQKLLPWSGLTHQAEPSIGPRFHHIFLLS